MTNRDMNYFLSCEKVVTVAQSFLNEISADSDEEFKIVDIIGNFELCVIKNQYGQSYKVNPKYLSR